MFDSDFKELNNVINRRDSLQRIEVEQLTINLADAQKKIAKLTQPPQTKEELLEEKINLTLMFIENEKALETLKIKNKLYTEIDKSNGKFKIDIIFRSLQTEKRLYEDFKNSNEFNYDKNNIGITYLENIRKLREKFYHEQDKYNLYMVDKDIQYIRIKNHYKIDNINIMQKISVIDLKKNLHER